MWPVLGGLISGGASLLGGMFSSDTAAKNTQANIAMQKETNQMSIAENQKNRDFQQQMSSTAYQRASTDMQAAGLNPMMMFGSGSAASSPSGGTPSLGTAKSENVSPYGNMGDAVTKAMSSAVAVKTMDKMASEMANLEAENFRIKEVTKNVAASTETEKRRPQYVHEQTRSVAQDVTAKKLDRARQEWEAIKHLDLSGIPDSARKAGNIGAWGGEKLADTVSPLLSSARGVKALLPRSSTREGSRSYAPDGKSFDEFWKHRTNF